MNSELVGMELRMYLHVDGIITSDIENIINEFSFYEVITSTTNVGLARGLNKLILSLKDENYIFRMDADDICCKERFKIQIKFMESHPELDFSGGSIVEFTGEQNNICQKRVYPITALDEYIIKASPFAHVTMCFRRGFFEKIGMYPTKYPLNEDIAYWFEAFKKGAKGSNVADILVKVRMDDAYSRRSVSKSYYELLVYLRIAKWKKKIPFIPFTRFLFRLIPKFLIKMIYNSNIRSKFLR